MKKNKTAATLFFSAFITDGLFCQRDPEQKRREKPSVQLALAAVDGWGVFDFGGLCSGMAAGDQAAAVDHRVCKQSGDGGVGDRVGRFVF